MLENVALYPLMLVSIAIGYVLLSDEERRQAMLGFMKRIPKAMGCFVDTLVGNALNDPSCNDVVKLQKQLDEVERRRQEDLEAKIKELELCARKEGLAQQEIEELKRAAQGHASDAHLKTNFKESSELKRMRESHPHAIFIQITGNTGTGKSTLMNDMIESICGEVDAARECKTGTRECTTETKFINVSKEIMPLLKGYISSNCLFNGEVEIFFCDQPGIGGVRVPTRSYFTNYSPGRYDFTIMTTANRITDDEYCIMTHLERYNKEFIVVKTMCDLPIYGMVTEDVKKKRIDKRDKFAVSNARLLHYDKIKREFNQQMKDMLKPEVGAETFFVGIEDNIEPVNLDLEKLKTKVYKWIVYEIQRRGAILKTENEDTAAAVPSTGQRAKAWLLHKSPSSKNFFGQSVDHGETGSSHSNGNTGPRVSAPCLPHILQKTNP